MNERDDSAADTEFAQQAKQLFDESVEGLDAATCSRLNRDRQTALAELKAGRPVWVQWAPAAGVAAAAVVAVVLWTGNQSLDEITPPSSATDFEILLTEDSLEMLEDLEFYSWIDLDETAKDNASATFYRQARVRIWKAVPFLSLGFVLVVIVSKYKFNEHISLLFSV